MSAPVDVLAVLNTLATDAEVREFNDAAETLHAVRAVVAELIENAHRCRFELRLAKPKGKGKQDSADIDGALELIDASLAKCGGAK